MTAANYLSRLAETRRGAWDAALAKVRDAGWRAHEVMASADVVRGVAGLLDPVAHGELRPQHLRMATREGELVFSPAVQAWRREPIWEERLAALGGDVHLRRALWILGDELALGNAELAARIELLDGVH